MNMKMRHGTEGIDSEVSVCCVLRKVALTLSVLGRIFTLIFVYH
ncbi:hypothetical protein E2C01_041267 [Portunus trituberculatus]|uniref:Uncharacterized protein n=1 Tax=Portunus trituberculatus TaxID=210409 RepID=A0A5B7FRG8_PORTR|nr:hypothetical protein [Portunus trituberculatus]